MPWAGTVIVQAIRKTPPRSSRLHYLLKLGWPGNSRLRVPLCPGNGGPNFWGSRIVHRFRERNTRRRTWPGGQNPARNFRSGAWIRNRTTGLMRVFWKWLRYGFLLSTCSCGKPGQSTCCGCRRDPTGEWRRCLWGSWLLDHKFFSRRS